MAYSFLDLAVDVLKAASAPLTWERERISRFQGVVFSVFVPGGGPV